MTSDANFCIWITETKEGCAGGGLLPLAMVHDHDDFCLQVELGDQLTDALCNMHAARVAALGAFGTGTHGAL